MRKANKEAFSIIELVAVVAILAILATALTPSLLRNISAVIYRKEASDLLACASALRASVQTHRVVPGTNEWALAVAAQMGVSASSLTTNIRNNSRVFLVDPAFSIGGKAPPYTNASGVIFPPISPRMILVSSTGQALPPLRQSDFNNLWLNPVGSVPAGAPWTGWLGHGDELVIQRVNLSDLFVHLVLFNYPLPQLRVPSFYIESPTNLTAMASSTNIYLLKGTVLGLYDGSSYVEQMVNRDSTFVFCSGVWRSSIYDLPVDPNLVGITQGFVTSRTNLNALNGQAVVLSAIQNYFQAYSAASADGFKGKDKKPLSDAQEAMMAAIAGLMNGPVQGQCQ